MKRLIGWYEGAKKTLMPSLKREQLINLFNLQNIKTMGHVDDEKLANLKYFCEVLIIVFWITYLI